MDYYTLLGVEKNSDYAQIKKQYYKLAKEFHPDKTKGDMQKQDTFIKLQAAYATLSNKEKRYMYDMTNSDDEILENIASFFSFHTTNNTFDKNEYQDPPNPIIEVKITLEEYCKGVKRHILVDEILKCNACNETGIEDCKQNIKSCPSCNSMGFDVNIPIFACGTCNGRGFNVVNYIKCKKCKGQGIIETATTQEILIPEKSQSGSIILTANNKFQIRYDFTNDFTEEGNIIIVKEISVVKWLCGGIHEVRLYSNRHILVKSEGSFNLSQSWTVDKNITLKFQLVMNDNVVKILRKCKDIFIKIFKQSQHTTNINTVDLKI